MLELQLARVEPDIISVDIDVFVVISVRSRQTSAPVSAGSSWLRVPARRCNRSPFPVFQRTDSINVRISNAEQVKRTQMVACCDRTLQASFDGFLAVVIGRRQEPGKIVFKEKLLVTDHHLPRT